jgi:hypothetical protein
MLLFTFTPIFIFAAAGSCSNLPSPQTATVATSELHSTIAISDILPGKLPNERSHAREITSIVSDQSEPFFTSPNQDATASDISTTPLTDFATLSATSTPLPDVPYAHHSDGSAITLAIVVSIIGGALLLTLAGWAWRKQKGKKSFGPDNHDTELAKHKILSAGGAPNGASRHYSRDMVEVDARPYQRSPTAPRYTLHH